MRTSMPNGFPQLPQADSGMSVSGRVAAVGPNVSVIPKMFGAGTGRYAQFREATVPPGCQSRRSGSAGRRILCRSLGLIGPASEQRHPLTPSSSTVAAGSGIARSPGWRRRPARSMMPPPNPPTQKNGIGRYNRLPASMRRAVRPARTAAECAAVGVDDTLGWTAAAGGEQDHSGSLGPHVAMGRGARRPVEHCSTVQTVCGAGSSGDRSEGNSSRKRCRETPGR